MSEMEQQPVYKIALGIEYDGSKYYGWQRQNEVRSVQEKLEKALSQVANEPITVFCAGRTDAGVHGTGQVVHFETRAQRKDAAWTLGVNANLPGDIAVRWVKHVPADFHARFSATGKTYRYCISRAPILNPFDAGLAWHRPLAWSVDILEQAVHLFRGTHDFTAFAALRGNEPRPIPEGYFRRTITQTQVAQTGEHVFITFTGTGFLYKMVRLMTGAAHEAARGKITLEELARLSGADLVQVIGRNGLLYAPNPEKPKIELP